MTCQVTILLIVRPQIRQLAEYIGCAIFLVLDPKLHSLEVQDLVVVVLVRGLPINGDVRFQLCLVGILTTSRVFKCELGAKTR